MIISFTLNGKPVEVDCEPERRLQVLLRDNFNLKGVHNNCRRGHCGLCSVFMNDKTVPSCMIPAFRVRGSRIETIEGFGTTKNYQDIEGAFRQVGVFLCSQCAPARVLTIEELLRSTTRPEGDDIDRTLSMVRCRCSAYAPLREAIKEAARRRRLQEKSPS